MSSDSKIIYLDHAATTPLDAEVLEKMLPFFNKFYGNPNGIHSVSQKASSALYQARRKVAAVLNCEADEIVFTSGGSESNNLAIRGIAFKERERKKKHLITTSTEHPAVVETIEQLCNNYNFTKTLLPVNSSGSVDPEELLKAIRPDTALISVIYANNEVGTIQPISTLSKIAREHEIPFHTDAVQAAGTLSMDTQSLKADLLSISGHKIYGPKGVGILFVRRGTSLLSHITGGSHEQNRRAGTENIPSIIGLSYALDKVQKKRGNECKRQYSLSKQLQNGLIERISGINILGDQNNRLAGITSFSIFGIDAGKLLMHLDLAGICASSGSACAVGNTEPSKVLLAMGLDESSASSTIRLSMGTSTQESDIQYVIEKLSGAVHKLRVNGSN